MRTQLTNNCTIDDNRRVFDGHTIGMMRCDWPFTVGYITTVIN